MPGVPGYAIDRLADPTPHPCKHIRTNLRIEQYGAEQRHKVFVLRVHAVDTFMEVPDCLAARAFFALDERIPIPFGIWRLHLKSRRCKCGHRVDAPMNKDP